MDPSAGAHYSARTAEEVFRDFRGRRAGMIKALTTDVEKFYQLCDPEKENLCLYGYPNETWEVTLPAEEVPPEIPEPALGINFARDGMDEKDWLALVAVHSDSWLLAVAFYFAARFGFDKEARPIAQHRQFATCLRIVTACRSPEPSRPESHSKATKVAAPPKDDDDESGEEYEEEEERDNTLCGSCGTNDGKDEFWICCDNCERWYHGKCVKITPARAEHIKHYKCPDCTNKRARA
nr:unnamed protein product [Digitaria exilis]